jgi:predicted nucleotide-binding protein
MLSKRSKETIRSKEAIALRRQALIAAAQTPRYPSVFISYSRKDKPIAKALADDLAAAGVPVWWDRDIYPGDDFHNAIVKALDEAQAVIVIWSEHSVASRWVRDEARRADRQNKLFTVHVPGFNPGDIPLGFGDNHSESIEERGRLLAALAARCPAAA